MIENYFKTRHAQYKKSAEKLTLKEWELLTLIIDQKQQTIESEIADKKEDLRYCDKYSEEEQQTKAEIIDLRKQYKVLDKICNKLKY